MDELPRARAFFRRRYTPAVEVRDPRSDRRFIVWLLGFAAAIDLANASNWTKFFAGVAIALVAIVYLFLRASRRRER